MCNFNRKKISWVQIAPHILFIVILLGMVYSSLVSWLTSIKFRNLHIHLTTLFKFFYKTKQWILSVFLVHEVLLGELLQWSFSVILLSSWGAYISFRNAPVFEYGSKNLMLDLIIIYFWKPIFSNILSYYCPFWLITLLDN